MATVFIFKKKGGHTRFCISVMGNEGVEPTRSLRNEIYSLTYLRSSLITHDSW